MIAYSSWELLRIATAKRKEARGKPAGKRYDALIKQAKDLEAEAGNNKLSENKNGTN